jgi:hypothetical protein
MEQSFGRTGPHSRAPDETLNPTGPSSVSATAVPPVTASWPVASEPLSWPGRALAHSCRPVARSIAMTWSQVVESEPYRMRPVPDSAPALPPSPLSAHATSVAGTCSIHCRAPVAAL